MKRLIVFLPILLLLLVPQALADSPVSVYVTDGADPVGGASVAVLISGASITGTTGADGLVTLTLPDGNYSFTAMKDGYATGSAYAKAGTDSSVTVKLSRLYGMSGTVVDASTGTALKDASVTITDKVSQKYYTGTSDSNGVFTVMVPDGYYSILVRAAYHNPAQRDNNGAGYHVQDNPLYVGYIPIAGLDNNTGSPEGICLSCDFPGKTVKTNETVSYDVKIANNGAVDKTYSLAVKDAPPGWDVKFYSGSDVINRVFVASGGSQTFQVKTTPLNTGSVSITIMAANGADNSSLQLFVDTSADKDYKLEFTVPENRTLDAGTTASVEVVVKNNGTGKLTNVGLDMGTDDIPDSLTVDTPTKIDELNPGDTHRFTLKVYAKADATAETDQLYLRAVSSETKTDKKTIDFTVTKSNTWIGIGIAIALIAILAFGYIVWKYGRR
jgi:hypothetical protein